MDRTTAVATLAATSRRHRFVLPGGRIVEVDVITCTAEEWDDWPELRSGQWSTLRTAAGVEAVRLTF